MKEVEKKGSSKGLSANNNNKMTDQDDHDKKSDTERIDHLGI